jgi:putative ABC transport system permease protein
MRPLDVFRYAFSDYTSNKFKTMMSSLGIIIGVASIIAILTLGDGLYAGISGEFNSVGADTIAILPMASMIQMGNDIDSKPAAHLTDLDVNSILNTSGVLSVHPEISMTADVCFNNTNRSVNAMAIIPSYEQRFVPDIAAGRFLDDSDSFSVVLGNTTANSTFGKQINPGDHIMLVDGETGQSHDYVVAGVLNKRNLSVLLGDSDSMVYMTKAGLAGISSQVTYSSIGAIATSADKADSTAKNINTTLTELHPEEAFSVVTQSTFTKMIGRIFDIIKYVLAGIAGVSLVVGGIGIMNVMMLTVRERVKEIGLMKAIGSTTMDVRLIFLTESALLGAISGLIGVLIAWMVAIVAGQLIDMSMPMSLQNILMGVGFGLIITVVFGVYPANQAAKMDPIEALRTE